MHRFARVVPLLLLPGAFLWSSACQDPTQVKIVLRSNLCEAPGGGARDVNVAIYGGDFAVQDIKDPERDQAQGDSRLCDGKVVRKDPTFFFHPSGNKDSLIDIRVVAAVKVQKPSGETTSGDPTKCPLVGLHTDDEGIGCVIQRRRLKYLPNQTVTVILDLDDDCLGEACAKDTTCVKAGLCVSSEIKESKTCTGPGCTLNVPDSGDGSVLQTGPVFLIAASDYATFAATADEIKLWGANSATASPVTSPTVRVSKAQLPQPAVQGLKTKIAQMGAGASHACAWYQGAEFCWGANESGQIGLGSKSTSVDNPTQTQTIPIFDYPANPQVPGNPPGSFVIAGGTTHGCILLNESEPTTPDMRIYCWGANDKGQLGENPGTESLMPKTVSLPGKRPIHLAAGGKTTCAVFDDKTARCWGSNVSGELGNGATPSASPSLAANATPDLEGKDYRWITVGHDPAKTFGCAIRNTGDVGYCWGANDAGQLGIGTSGAPQTSPNEIPTVRFKQIVAGGAHACGIKTDDHVACWGKNDKGQAGGPPGANVTTPIGAGPNKTVIQLALGLNHSCALTSDFLVYCWGANDVGQLADGTTASRGDPKQVVGF